jgi:Fe(3+) dicitrate transport protein
MIGQLAGSMAEARAARTARSSGLRSGYFGTRGGPVGLLLDGVHLGSDGFKTLPSGSSTDYYRNEWMVKGSYMFDADTAHDLALKVTYSDELSNETYLGLTDPDFRDDALQRYAASELDRLRNHRTSIVLIDLIDPSDTIAITASVYRHHFLRVWRKVNGFRGASLFEALTNLDAPRTQIFAICSPATSTRARRRRRCW